MQRSLTRHVFVPYRADLEMDIGHADLIQRIISLFWSAFHMFVPSLSWQNNRFLIKQWRKKYRLRTSTCRRTSVSKSVAQQQRPLV